MPYQALLGGLTGLLSPLLSLPVCALPPARPREQGTLLSHLAVQLGGGVLRRGEAGLAAWLACQGGTEASVTNAVGRTGVWAT